MNYSQCLTDTLRISTIRLKEVIRLSDTATLNREATNVTSELWDYAVANVHARQAAGLEEALKERGRNGWELVFMHEPMPCEYRLVFRRRLVEC